jgi:hypothetical protein
VLEADYGNPNIYSALEEEKLDNRTLENVYDEINRGGVPNSAQINRKSLDFKSSKLDAQSSYLLIVNKCYTSNAFTAHWLRYRQCCGAGLFLSGSGSSSDHFPHII